MTGCGDCSHSLRRYLDQELYGQELVQFRAHLKECAACRRELEEEQELSRLLHQSRPLYSAPASLRARVLEAIGEPDPEILGPRPKRQS